MKRSLDNYPRSVWEHLIDEWIFDERNRRIVKRKLYDNPTFEQLSEEFNLSPQQVKKIFYKAIDKISKYI